MVSGPGEGAGRAGSKRDRSNHTKLSENEYLRIVCNGAFWLVFGHFHPSRESNRSTIVVSPFSGTVG